MAEVSQPPTKDPGKRDIPGASKDTDSAPAGATRVTDLRERESAGARKSRESAQIGPPLGACASVCQAIGGGKVAGKPAPPPRHWPEASLAATQLASGAPSRERIGRGQGPSLARFGRPDWLAGRGRYPASASPPLVGGERGLGTAIGGRGAGPGPAGSGLVGK